jgi:signal transduction histidine kinase
MVKVTNHHRPILPAATSASSSGPTGFLQMEFLVRPPNWGRRFSAFIIIALVVLFTLVELVTGPYVSMRVFFDIPVMLAVVWLGGPSSVAVCAASILALHGVGWIEGAAYARTPQIYWNLPVGFAAYLVLAWILLAFVKLHRQLELRVRQRTAALEREISTRLQLQREVLFTSDRERSAIGQDLHDGLCQHLVGTALSAQVLTERLASRDAPCMGEARNLVRLIEEGIAQTRHLARGLLLASVKPECLPAELEEMAVSMSRQSGVPCRFVMQGDCDARDEQTASHLFLIAQEAVRNALRHARPRQLEIMLTARNDQLMLIISDDGTGLPSKRAGRGMGLRIMEHRAKIIGGDLVVEQIQGGGTSIHCRVPAGTGAG